MVLKSKIPATIAELELIAHEIPKETASFLKEKMKDSILKQAGSGGWLPLSRFTLAIKAPERRILYDSGRMVQDIKVRSKKNTATVGIHEDAENHDIGVWNEYGTLYIPSRSFIRSTWTKYEKEVIGGIVTRFLRGLKRFVR